jgi:fructosamine-3-kinase
VTDVDTQLLPTGLAALSARPLTGGSANPVWLCELADGRSVVVKLARASQPDLTELEAEGLHALAELGGLATPAVLAVSPRVLVLDAVHPELPGDDREFWAAAGRAVARMHVGVRSDRHGWAHDGWLGRFRQRNAWDADGHRFFAEKRVLRYLGEPLAEAALSADDRLGIERLCARMPELLPDTGAALTHGDLWRNNLLVGHAGEPVFVDPAVSYAWPEIDVAMMLLAGGGAPESFFAGYAELRPLHPDWREHARLLNLRELLTMTATFGADAARLAEIRHLVRRYA